MRAAAVIGAGLLVATIHVGWAMRPVEDRSQADVVVSGVVTAVYSRETTGYWDYIVEIKVDAVEKGAGIQKGDTFRAFCYQRKEGKGGLQYDTAGHQKVPKEGQSVKAYVKRAHGQNEGVYPDWIDIHE